VARLRLPSIAQVPGGRGFAALSRRVRTLIITGVLFLILFILALTMPVPYVVLSPGPTLNTLGKDDRGAVIITINGKTAKNTTGHLNLTTVSETDEPITAFQALTGWLEHDQVVVPKSSVDPPGQSQQQTDQQNTQDFVGSQDNATIAALCELGYPKGFGVVGVPAGSPSSGKLKVGDQIVTVDGKAANTAAKLGAVLGADKTGQQVAVVVKRLTRTVDAQVTLAAPMKGQKPATPRLGVIVSQTCLAPFTVTLGLANQIGGPSAGLMFALGIMDKVGTVDLTKGRFIAGTGEIDPAGNVSPIGGIQLKMIAAKAKGASVFLAPAANCGDVRGATPKGLRIIRVSTLHGAVESLLSLQKGGQPRGC
jgi:PDZ domain-containing protein